MSHINPFTISGYEFRNVTSDDDEIYVISDKWNGLKSSAAMHWRHQPLHQCDHPESYEIFAIYDSEDLVWGIWSIYRIRDVSPTSISALCSPTFPTVSSDIPQDSFGPDGTTLINAEDIAHGIQTREKFWRQTFACIESMLLFPMELEDGSTKSIDHFRFPSVADGDPEQQEWRGVKDCFDQYCKIEVEFDEDGTAVKTLPGWKSVDPDPDRPVGEFS